MFGWYFSLAFDPSFQTLIASHDDWSECKMLLREGMRWRAWGGREGEKGESEEGGRDEIIRREGERRK